MKKLYFKFIVSFLLMMSRPLMSQFFVRPPNRNIENVEAEILANDCRNLAVVSENPSNFYGGVSFPAAAAAATYPVGSQFSWLIPIFEKTDKGLEFLCGGTLYSRKLIITAAHCVHLFQPQSLVVFLGRKKIKEWAKDAEGEAYDIDNVIVNERYETEKASSSSDLTVEGDIAVLLLKEAANLRKHNITIIDLADKPRTEYYAGTFVGWGKDEFDNSVKQIPKAGNVRIINNDDCIRQDESFARVVSENVFCAGYQNGTAPCKGDSGGGLFVEDKYALQGWRLLGVIKTGTFDDNNKENCDRFKLSTYTDISQYKTWLENLKLERDEIHKVQIQEVVIQETILEERMEEGYGHDINKAYKCKDLFGEAYAFYKLDSQIKERYLYSNQPDQPTNSANINLNSEPKFDTYNLRKVGPTNSETTDPYFDPSISKTVESTKPPTTQAISLRPDNLLSSILFYLNPFQHPYTSQYSYSYNYTSENVIDIFVRLTVNLNN